MHWQVEDPMSRAAKVRDALDTKVYDPLGAPVAPPPLLHPTKLSHCAPLLALGLPVTVDANHRRRRYQAQTRTNSMCGT